MLIVPFPTAVIRPNVLGLVLFQAAFQRGRIGHHAFAIGDINAFTVLAGIVLIIGGTALLHLKPSSEPQGLVLWSGFVALAKYQPVRGIQNLPLALHWQCARNHQRD